MFQMQKDLLRQVFSKQQFLNKQVAFRNIMILAIIIVTKIKLLLILLIPILYLFSKYKASKVVNSLNKEKESSFHMGSITPFDIISNNNPGGELPFILGHENGNTILGDMAELLSTLVAGLPGKGKSNFINQLLQSLLYWCGDRIVMLLIDFKKVELSHDYKHFKNCFSSHSIEELKNILKKLVVEMDRRYDLLVDVPIGTKAHKKLKKFNQKNKSSLPYILLLIDEFADLNDIEDPTVKAAIWSDIRELLRKGRAAGIILVLATQRPTKENIPPAIKSLCNSKIGFGVNDNNESTYCGVKDTANLEKGYYKIVSEGNNFNNRLLKSYLIEDDEQTYKILTGKHLERN